MSLVFKMVAAIACTVMVAYSAFTPGIEDVKAMLLWMFCAGLWYRIAERDIDL